MLIEFNQKALNLKDAIPAAHDVHHVDVCVPLIMSANEHQETLKIVFML